MDHYDSVEITALLSTTSICDDCLAFKTGLSVRRVQRVVRTQITKSLKIATSPGRCGRCLKQTVVHELGIDLAFGAPSPAAQKVAS